jgi:3-deoxy-7-phosphoheptulonate synthase
MKKSNKEWHKASWRELPIKQQPKYEDLSKLHNIEHSLSALPSLVYFDEINKLKTQLAETCLGKSFLLQGGDCAESFSEFSETNLKNYFQVILQMTAALMHGCEKPVVKIGRIAGQFAKPRSANYENISGQEIPSYRGDMVNNIAATKEARIANPQNLLEAYKQSGVTLNFIRSLAAGGYSSLDNIHQWLNNFADSTKHNKKLLPLIKEIEKSIRFFKACRFDLSATQGYNSADFFSSHEALILNYEQALTRFNPVDGKEYCCSAHMLWIGDRTRNINEAHIEFMRGIANPVGMKVGPSMREDDLLKLIETLNPHNEAGKITLISRMGAKNIIQVLPKLVEKVKNSGYQVIWSCDPMHGNTETSNNNYKTRKFDNILTEVNHFFDVHQAVGTYAGGVHIEMTGQNVTECLGGVQDITEVDLANRYNTLCDPRLNGMQSLELAFLIAQKMQKIS